MPLTSAEEALIESVIDEAPNGATIVVPDAEHNSHASDDATNNHSGKGLTIQTVSGRAVHWQAANSEPASLLTAAIADPGDAGAIPVSGADGVCHLSSAAAETRTLARPVRVDQRLTLAFKADGGDIVLTATPGVNQAGNTSLTFADAGDIIALIGVEVGSALVWRVLANDGVALA